ncbi:hypothetical protein B0H13DRAFT_2301151 [Mycena leptocephala]|nr:hypothetical protein B0H13DRAFT_2301151 [Mycena leptocephala]
MTGITRASHRQCACLRKWVPGTVAAWRWRARDGSVAPVNNNNNNRYHNHPGARSSFRPSSSFGHSASSTDHRPVPHHHLPHISTSPHFAPEHSKPAPYAALATIHSRLPPCASRAACACYRLSRKTAAVAPEAPDTMIHLAQLPHLDSTPSVVANFVIYLPHGASCTCRVHGPVHHTHLIPRSILLLFDTASRSF